MNPATLHTIQAQAPGLAVSPLRNPFPGLRPFEEHEAELFFGRESQIEALLKKLQRQRLLAVVGNSGSGKSSLVLAGVLPRLRRGYRGLGGTSWRIARMRPGRDPLGNLATALQLAREQSEYDEYTSDYRPASEVRSVVQRDVLRAELERSAEGLVETTFGLELDPDENLLLLIDQFEELFRFQQLAEKGQHDQASAFVRLLLRGAGQSNAPIYVLLTMRSDFLGECVRFRGLAEALNEGQYLVPLLTRDERALAIRGPLGLVGANISTALLQQLLNDAGELNDQLPVLQHALMRTFDLATEGAEDHVSALRLELSHYMRAGRMEQALSMHADEAYAAIADQLGETGKRATEMLFRCLTEPGEHGQGVRRPCQISEVVAVTDTPLTMLRRIVAEFTAPGRGFLTQQPAGEVTPETTLDISHESLMRKWDRLKDWTAAEIAFNRQLSTLDEAVRGYENKTRGLLRDPELSLALKWQLEQRPTTAAGKRYQVDLEAVERFLRESRRAARLRGWMLWTAVGLTVLTLSIFGLVVYQEKRRAEQSALQARVALAAARTATLVRLAKEVDEGSVLAAEFLREAVQDEAERTRAWQDIASITAQKPWMVELKGHTDRVTAAMFSSDGKRVVTASYDRTARVWESETGRQVAELKGHTGVVASAMFSSDGRRVVTASLDKTAQVWESETGKQVAELRGHTDVVSAAMFSSDGKRAVTSSRDNTARVWESETGRQVAELKGHMDALRTAMFSSDGKRVVTASWDKTARVWESETGRQVAELKGHTDAVSAAMFSSDGKRVVTASWDKTARVWESETGRQVAELKGHTGYVPAAMFSSDGKRVVTASDDRTARVWESEAGRLVAELNGHTDAVVAAMFSSDGKRVVTASLDKTARVWESETGRQVAELKKHTGYVTAAVFSSDGKRVVTASWDNTARVWESEIGRQMAEFRGHTGTVYTAMFSSDGKRVVTASSDSTARVWESKTGRQVAELKGHADAVMEATFSSDGERVVTASSDKTARVWESETGRQVAELKGHTGHVRAAMFSRDGRRVVTASDDSTARVWESETGRQVAELKGHTGYVTAAMFSSDGKRVVTASSDNTARVWESETGRQVAELKGHTGVVASAMFSSDGKHVVTASWDSTARAWESETGKQVAEFRGHTGTVHTAMFSSDGKRVVTASSDSTARAWESETGKQVAEFRGHTGTVYTAMFSSDGKRAVTASSDNTSRVWESETGKQVGELNGHTGGVIAAMFSSDGERVVTASRDWSAGLWQGEGRPTRFLGRGSAHHRAVVHERNGHPVAEVWDEDALTWRDARVWFWQQLPYCMSEEQRRDSLIETPEQARAGYELCRKTVEACKGSSFEACAKVVRENYAPPK